jgi:hypothetical protein
MRIPRRILDQGNSVLRRIHGMGFGLRAPLPMPGTTGSATPVPAGVRLLPFAIVAKVPACNDDQLAAVYAESRRLGIGSGNYERWESTTTFYVYDIDRSIGYLVNQTARAIAEALSLVATGRSPLQRLHIVSNDCYSGQSGAHWFSVVAEMVDGAEAGSGTDAAAMDVDHIDRTGGGLALGPAVRAAVDGFLAGVFAGTRRDISVAEMRGRMSNFTARELDAALAALQRDGDIRVEGGVIRLVDD